MTTLQDLKNIINSLPDKKTYPGTEIEYLKEYEEKANIPEWLELEEHPQYYKMCVDTSTSPFKVNLINEQTGETVFEGEGEKGLVELHKTCCQIKETNEKFKLIRDDKCSDVLKNDNDFLQDMFSPYILDPERPAPQADYRLVFNTRSAANSKRERSINAWVNFMKTYIAWKEDPTDFYKSYELVTTHPLKWLNKDTDKHCLSRYVKPEHDIHHTEHDVKDYEHCVSIFPASDDRTETCSDWDLETHGKTYEEAIIMLAQQCDKHYTPEGVRREGISGSHEELINMLQERKNELDENPYGGISVKTI